MLVGPKPVDIEKPPLFSSLRGVFATLGIPAGFFIQTVEIDESSGDSFSAAQQEMRSPIKCAVGILGISFLFVRNLD
jgi:hypothetical protein